ncbi:MAG: hypothetical protein EBY24_22860 [Betaproteobacteria bacterium]|nr:hypothetical protein [Betaproteobacteria bacterium]
MPRPDGLHRLRIPGLPVFDVLGLVQHDSVEFQAVIALRIPPDQCITGHHDVAVGNLAKAREPVRSVQR